MGTAVFTQIPYLDTSVLITRDQLSLIRMDYDVVNRGSVVVIALYTSRAKRNANMSSSARRGSRSVSSFTEALPCIPDLDSAVFTSRCKPLPLTVEGYRSHVPLM